MSVSYVVRALRSTPRPAATVALLRDLGLHRLHRPGEDANALFVGRSGSVEVRGTAAGATTALQLVGDDPGAVAKIVRGPGTLVLELLSRTDPENATTDLTSDLTSEGVQVVAASMDVVVTCTTADLAAAADFLATFGFRPLEPDSPRLTAGSSSGIIRLVPADGAAEWFGLGFETSEPLDALAARLGDAGHRAEVVEDAGGVRVEIIDPDSHPIIVRLTGS